MRVLLVEDSDELVALLKKGLAQGGFSAMMTTQVLEAVTLRARPYVHVMADDDERNAEILSSNRPRCCDAFGCAHLSAQRRHSAARAVSSSKPSACAVR